MFLMKSNY